MIVLLESCIGLGIFLFGMKLMENNLARLGSARAKAFLSRSTSRPLASVASGTVITAVLQSSSMVSLMVLAFASAGMIPLFNAVGVILGANLGTTFTGWIVTTFGFKLDLASVATPLFGLPALVYVFSEGSPRVRGWAGLLLGLGVLLLGLEHMKAAVSELPNLIDPQRLEGLSPLSYLLTGMVLTAIIQSSSAMTMIALTALHAGLIDLPDAAAIVIGADIGTTSTTLLGSLSGRPIARQLALAHLVYNLFVDALAFLLLLPVLPAALGTLGIVDPLYGLVLFHSSFNLLGLVVFVPLLKPFSLWLSHRFGGADVKEMSYLQQTPVSVTDAAMVALEKECRALIKRIFRLNIKALRLQIALRPSDEQPDLSQPLSEPDFLLEYETCKGREAEIHQYYALMHTAALRRGEIEHARHLMDSVRSAIYAAKTLKDILDDLRYFTSLKDGPAYQVVYPQPLHEVLTLLDRGLCDYFRPAEVVDYCHTLRGKTDQSKDSMNRAVMLAVGNEELNYAQLPSLLNAIREIVYSTHSLIDAYESLLKTPDNIFSSEAVIAGHANAGSPAPVASEG